MTAVGSAPVAVGAVDLGATSGRVIVGCFDGDAVTLHTVRRFPNGSQPLHGHLSWDIDALWEEIQEGLRAAGAVARELGADGLASIGIDSWAVDYGLLTPEGERIGEVISYRDDRTDGAQDIVASRVPAAAQYDVTGLAQLPFNTVYQLAIDGRLAAAPDGTQALLVPDLIGFLLTGVRRTEMTNASTTGALDVRTGMWSEEILAATGTHPSLFPELIAPGQMLGTVSQPLAAALGIGEIPVIAVGSHDTASAVLAVPAAEGPAAYISSGTWSLVGLELDSPVVTEQARSAGFTNERGVDGTIRFLKNVTGMWLLTECLDQWKEAGNEHELTALLAAAADEPEGTALIDATDPAFIPPGNMADRIVAAARTSEGEPLHDPTPARITRCILDSLAHSYARTLRTACDLANVPLPSTLHVVGGGCQNTLLNELTASALDLTVIAGPVEATALGNICKQLQALGFIADGRAAIREVVRRSVTTSFHHPTPQGR